MWQTSYSRNDYNSLATQKEWTEEGYRKGNWNYITVKHKEMRHIDWPRKGKIMQVLEDIKKRGNSRQWFYREKVWKHGRDWRLIIHRNDCRRKLGKIIIHTYTVIPYFHLLLLFQLTNWLTRNNKPMFNKIPLYAHLTSETVKPLTSYLLKNLRISSTVVDHGKPRSFTTQLSSSWSPDPDIVSSQCSTQMLEMNTVFLKPQVFTSIMTQRNIPSWSSNRYTTKNGTFQKVTLH